MSFPYKPIVIVLVWSANVLSAAGQSILPKSFAGWTQTGSPVVATQAQQLDSANAAVLKEYGFTTEETANYTRPDGRKLTVKAAEFKDATGAYGAFTFYRDPAMNTESIGSKAASANERIVFFRSNIVVDASFDHVTGMSAAELRDLAAALPQAKGTAANPPTLPEYLPKKNAEENSARYILGPQALAATKTPLSADAVGFNFDPEILTQNYTTPNGPVSLMLIQYPTPQIATGRLRALQAANTSNALALRRTGPILIAESGNLNSDEAKNLLNSVNYEAEVTWNEATSVSKKNNVGNLLLAVFALIGILLLIGLIFGVFLGGIRVLASKYMPGTVLDLPENVEILQLHLDDHPSSE
jgi:hypothetical protein